MRRHTKTHENIFNAAEHGDFEAVKSYVEDKNIPLTRIDHSNQTVAHIAAKHGNLRLLRYLLDENPSILPLVDEYNKPVLYRAIQSGSLEMIKYLVEECKVNVQEKHARLFGNTALHFASELGKLTVLRYFIEEKHADVNVKNDVGETPLFAAAQEKRIRVVKYLVEEQNADLTVIDTNGENILYTVVWKNELRLVKYFLRKTDMIDVDRRNDSGDTVLNRATKLKHLELVEYLVREVNADVNIPDNTRMTPLHHAVRLNSLQLVSFLVEHGADVGYKNNRGKTPLDEATDYKIINYLDEAERKLSRHRNRRKASTYDKRAILPTWPQRILEDLLPDLRFSRSISHYPISFPLHTGHHELAFSK